VHVTSKLVLSVAEQVPHGIDRVLGDTAGTASGSGDSAALEVSDAMAWYVRPLDPEIGGAAIASVIAEARERGFPGLSLASCRHLDDGFAPLLAGADLRLLDLFNTPTGDAALAALSGQLPRLARLNLAGTLVTDGGLAHLRGLPALEFLHLGWTEVGDGGLADLAALPHLKTLVLHGTRVTDAGMASLARSASLEALDLQETAVSDAGVRALAPLSPRLVRLYLGYTAVTDGCVADLRRFARLRTLMLRATRVTPARDDELASAMPDLGGLDTGPGGIQEGIIR
jgi:Leucine Rich repeat